MPKSTGSLERWCFWGLIIFAALLRVSFLGQGVVGGDEIHPLQVLRSHSLGHILTHYHKPDNCIPITVWCWLLAHTVGLEEWGFRLWSWLPGIVLVWVLPRAVRTFLGSGERLLLAAVVASSPLLVHWSREARPYSAITLFGTLAVMAVGRYALDRRARWLVASAVCQFVTFALSPTTAPFLAALAFASALGSWTSAREHATRERLKAALHMVAPPLLALLLILILLGPAMPSLFKVMGGGTATNSEVTLRTWSQSARLVYGFPKFGPGALSRYLPILTVLLTLWGVVRLWGLRRSAGVAAITILLLPAIAYSASNFHEIGSMSVFVRYQAALVPLYLSLMVLGFGDLRRRVAGHWAHTSKPVLLAAFGLIAGLTILGPISTALPPRYPFGFRASRMFRTSSLTAWKNPAFTPQLYHNLAEEPPTLVVEWPSRSRDELAYAYYQALHHGRVIRCRPAPAGQRAAGRIEGLRFRTFSWEDALLKRGVPAGTVIILHRQPKAEAAHVKSGFVLKRPPETSKSRRFARECRKLLGAPFYEDEWVIAFRAP